MRRGFSSFVFRLRYLLKFEEGQSMVEYALLSSIVTLGFVALFKNIAAELVVLYTGILTKIAAIF
jgi:Flp pilus assembly pilin Flp